MDGPLLKCMRVFRIMQNAQVEFVSGIFYVLICLLLLYRPPVGYMPTKLSTITYNKIIQLSMYPSNPPTKNHVFMKTVEDKKPGKYMKGMLGCLNQQKKGANVARFF